MFIILNDSRYLVYGPSLYSILQQVIIQMKTTFAKQRSIQIYIYCNDRSLNQSHLYQYKLILMNRKTKHRGQLNCTQPAFMNRTFNSPKHHANQIQYYNTYMNNQKTKKQQQPKLQNQQSIINLKNIKQTNNTRSVSPNYSSVIVAQLIKQNDFLIDQVLKYKETVQGYERAMNRLKRSKSQKCATATQPSSSNIAIIDYENCNRLNLNFVQSKLITQRVASQSRDQNDTIQKQSRHKQLLEQSLIYIKHSRNSASYQIQQLNDKLCRLLERSAVQSNKQKRKNIRLQISECVKDLKYLRKQYEQLYC